MSYFVETISDHHPVLLKVGGAQEQSYLKNAKLTGEDLKYKHKKKYKFIRNIADLNQSTLNWNRTS